MAPNSKIDASISAIVKHMNKLGKMNVPAAISILHGGKTHHFGSKFTREFLKSRPELTKELEKDALVLCRGEGEISEMGSIMGEDGDKTRPVTLVEIPAPIELLNKSETVTALRDLIVYDHHNDTNRAGKGGKWIKYGQPSWEPSFWPNRLWKWSQIQNFAHLTVQQMKDQGLGNRFSTLVDFFKYVIHIGFDQLDLDPNECLAKTYDNKEERKRKKKRHIKIIPTAESPEMDDQVDAVEGLPSSEEDFAGQHYEYRRSPITTSPSNTETSDAHLAESSTREFDRQVEEVINQETNESPADNSNAQPMIEKLLLSVDTEDIPVPHCLVSKLWENAVIKRNQRGSSTITCAAVQSFGLAERVFWKLKLVIHDKIIANFSDYRHLYYFPVQLQDESGLRIFQSESELLSYLGSASSISVRNIPLVEILVLANIIGATVNVLHQAGGEAGQQNWQWERHPPAGTGSIDKQGNFYTGRELNLITEDDKHFYLLTSASSTLPRTVPDQENDDAAVIAEAEETMDTVRFAMVPVGTLAKKDKTVDHDSRSDSELRRSKRASKKTERYQQFTTGKRKRNNDQSQNKRQKKAGDVLERLSPSVIAEKDNMTTHEQLETHNGGQMPYRDREIDLLHEYTNDISRKMLAKKIEEKKLVEMGQELRNALTEENIKEMFYDNLQHFIDIKSGKVKTWRSSWYKAGKEDSLMFHLVAGPFSERQQNVIFDEMRKNFMKDGIPSRFNDFVLLPEIYIRIYQLFFQLTKKEAEKNLKEKHLYYNETGSDSSNGTGTFIK